MTHMLKWKVEDCFVLCVGILNALEMLLNEGSYAVLVRGVGSGPAGPFLAGPLFIKVKTKFHFATSK